MKTLPCLKLAYNKNYFNLTKIFVLKLFKMLVNQAKSSRLEQCSVMKSLVVEKCKPCEYYWRMCMENHVFVRKVFINWLHVGLSLQVCIERKKVIPIVNTFVKIHLIYWMILVHAYKQCVCVCVCVLDMSLNSNHHFLKLETEYIEKHFSFSKKMLENVKHA